MNRKRFQLVLASGAATLLATAVLSGGAGAAQRSGAPVRQDFPPLPGSTNVVVVTIPTQKPGPAANPGTTHKKRKPVRCKKGYRRVKVKGKYVCRKIKR